MELFNDFFEVSGGFEFLSRSAHVLSGIAWIGLLYYFNFVQTPAFAELSDAARGEALRKITWRALWWFRWAAASTFLFGLLIISVQNFDSDEGSVYFEGPAGTSILTGVLFGVTMFLNVWGIIWRHQKVIIGSAERVAAGGEADPRAAALAKPAARASRCNTLFSIPMLFFMVFTSHLSTGIFDDVENLVVYWIVVLALWAFIEASALGLIGGFDNAFNKLAFDKHQNTIWAGFALLAVIYFVGWEAIAGVAA